VQVEKSPSKLPANMRFSGVFSKTWSPFSFGFQSTLLAVELLGGVFPNLD